MVTRTFKITSVAHIVFLLDSAPFRKHSEHRLGNPRYIHLGNCATFVRSLQRTYVVHPRLQEWIKTAENNILTRMPKLAHLGICNSKGMTDRFPFFVYHP